MISVVLTGLAGADDAGQVWSCTDGEVEIGKLVIFWWAMIERIGCVIVIVRVGLGGDCCLLHAEPGSWVHGCVLTVVEHKDPYERGALNAEYYLLSS